MTQRELISLIYEENIQTIRKKNEQPHREIRKIPKQMTKKEGGIVK